MGVQQIPSSMLRKGAVGWACIGLLDTLSLGSGLGAKQMPGDKGSTRVTAIVTPLISMTAAVVKGF